MANEDTKTTLTDISYLGRQGLKFGLIAVVVFMVSRTLFTAFVAYWKATHPPPPPPPTVGFGVLPPLAFSEKSDDQKPSSYKLETATGGLPYFGDRAKVFLMLHGVPSLLDNEKAKKFGASLGYMFTPEIIDSYIYRFSKSNPIVSTLEYNVITNDFSITTDYLSRPEIATNRTVPDEADAVNRVKNLLSSVSLLSEDIATVSGETIYMKAIGTELEPALSFSDAQFVQVEIRRLPIDDIHPFYSPEGEYGNISAVLSGSLSGIDSIVEMIYFHQEVDYTQVHTYPIRTTQEAWKLMQAGEGYVAQKGQFDTAVVREVELGYYDAFEQQDYMQPIYVFKGDGGFIGYVSAVRADFIQSAQVQ